MCTSAQVAQAEGMGGEAALELRWSASRLLIA